jgi:N-acetylmuramoyl-L-alanine amidase
MVREGDVTLAPDQRAVVANTSQAAVYVSIHAGGVTAPAVAVEVGPPGDNMETLNNADYQERIAIGLVAALASVKPQLERRP